MIRRETGTDTHTENSQIQDPVSWVGGNMRQHSGSMLSISRVKKYYKNNKTCAVCCWVHTALQLKLLNTKICFDLYLLPGLTRAPWSISRCEMCCFWSEEKTATRCDRCTVLYLLQAWVHSPCKALLCWWVYGCLQAGPGSSCYVLRLLQICSGVLLWSEE